jgi:hypothetical protein
MADLSNYFTRSIELAKDNEGVEAAKTKYTSFFIDKTSFASYRASVDAQLTADGYQDCIVVS